MLEKLSCESKKLIDALNNLSREGVVSYSIDYEAYECSDDDLTETFGHWFGGTKWKNSGDSFIQFGQDGSGSLFLLWFYPGLAGEPPVVFMGSEGEAHFVAPNIKSFVMQLCSGKLFYDGGWLEPEDDEKEELDWDVLKSRAEELVGPIAKNPEEIRDEGLCSCPSFPDWVKSKVEY